MIVFDEFEKGFLAGGILTIVAIVLVNVIVRVYRMSYADTENSIRIEYFSDSGYDREIVSRIMNVSGMSDFEDMQYKMNERYFEIEASNKKKHD